jgi:hypothetical protein
LYKDTAEKLDVIKTLRSDCLYHWSKLSMLKFFMGDEGNVLSQKMDFLEKFIDKVLK